MTLAHFFLITKIICMNHIGFKFVTEWWKKKIAKEKG
jgi:hypothetical protein